MAEAQPAAYLPDLAASLNNLSNRLGELGRTEEGLATITEAVEIRRRLAEAQPAAYLPDLAASLNNLSLRLGALGRTEEGLAAITEAVEVRIAGWPKLSRPGSPRILAQSLNNLADLHDKTGNTTHANTARNEAHQLATALDPEPE